MDQTQEKIKEFLSRFFRNHDLKAEEDIFALGFVNSLLAMQLVAFVEKEFGIKVEDEDLDLDNFRSINAISSLVARKSGGASPAAAAAQA
ncbi:MAG TPA: acyl carrier protein [Thermoanaerobaculia bacterium]|jgi:acyl carrier protein|nr:acyl carrier protein [Thermoanaerobaculia bacterium]